MYRKVSKPLAILALPFSLGGALAIIMRFYAETADAQRASSELVSSFVPILSSMPKLIFFLGLLSLMIAGAYAVISFASSGSKRVNARTQLLVQPSLRLAGHGTIVGRRLLASGFDVANDGVYVETNYGRSAGTDGEYRSQTHRVGNESPSREVTRRHDTDHPRREAMSNVQAPYQPE